MTSATLFWRSEDVIIALCAPWVSTFDLVAPYFLLSSARIFDLLPLHTLKMAGDGQEHAGFKVVLYRIYSLLGAMSSCQNCCLPAGTVISVSWLYQFLETCFKRAACHLQFAFRSWPTSISQYITQRHLACGNWMKGRRVFSYATI